MHASAETLPVLISVCKAKSSKSSMPWSNYWFNRLKTLVGLEGESQDAAEEERMLARYNLFAVI